MKPPVLDDGAELRRTVPSEASPIGVSLCFPSDLHRCHMSQQSTWIALVPFVEIKSQHWLYSSAIDPPIFCLHGTHTVTSMQSVTLLTLCQLSRPCWWKADLLMTPSAADCLRSDAAFHSSVCSLSPLAFSLLLSLSLSRSLFVEISVQPCPLCRKLSGAAVSL